MLGVRASGRRGRHRLDRLRAIAVVTVLLLLAAPASALILVLPARASFSAAVAPRSPVAAATVPANCTYKTIAGGDGFSFAVKTSGTVWAWGVNFSYQLGNGTTTDSPTPVQIPGLDNVVAVSSGSSWAMAMKKDGTVWAWGANTRGVTGQPGGTNPHTPLPHQVPGLSGIIAIAAGSTHGLALKVDGTVWGWGDNSGGQLGNGTAPTTSNDVATQTPGLPSITAIGAGRFHSLAVDVNGTVWAWGDNGYGQLGDGTTNVNASLLPLHLSSLTNIAAVSGGRIFSAAVDTSGDVWTWGANFNGQLGDGTLINRSSPAKASIGGVSAVASATHADFALALKSNAVWAWGAGFQGQMGNGTALTNNPTPTQAAISDQVSEVATGQQHALALLPDGTMRGWGGGLGSSPVSLPITGVAQPGHCVAPPPPPAPGPTPATQVGGGSPSVTSPNSCQHRGQPVNCATGEFWHRFVDLSIKGRGPAIWLARTYSTSLASQDSPLGFGWTHSYNMALSVGSDGSVTVREEGGSVITFAPDGMGGYVAAQWLFAALTKNPDGTYTMRRNNQASFIFNASGQLVREQDRNGYATSLVYSNGQITTVMDAGGRQLQLQYSGGHLVAVTDPIQRAVAFQYDTAGNLIAATDVGGGVTKFTYDANHLLLTMTDPRGGVTTNTYDAAGRVLGQTDALNRTTGWAYGTGRTTITDAIGNVTQHTYANGQLVALTKGFGSAVAATWSLTYDPKTFAVASTTDPNGHTTQFARDSRGNLLSATDALGRTWTFSYDALNNLTTASDPLGAVTAQLAYDPNGNVVSIARPAGGTAQAITQIAYDPSHPGDAVAITDPDGNTWHLAYDGLGNTVRANDPLGNTTTTSFDVVSRPTASVSARGNVSGARPADFTTSYAFTPFDNVRGVTDPLGHVTSIQYDANQNVVGVSDANGRTTTYAYNLDNEPVAGTRADGSQGGTVYDATGHVTSQSDALGHTTTYSYDAQERLVRVTDPLGRSSSITYDAAGNPTVTTDPMGRTSSFVYDAANQVTGVTYSDGKTPNVSFNYDADGRRIRMTDGTGVSSYAYDTLGRLVQSINGAGASVGYGYDLRSDVTSLTYPDGSRVGRTFDASGRLTSTFDWLGNHTTYGYDANANLTSQGYPNGTRSSLSYDAADRLTGIRYSGPMGQLTFSEGRDKLGQLTSEMVQGAPPGGPVAYQYDQVNRLTVADYGFAKLSYQYDAAGRLTQTSTTSWSGSVVSNLAYDVADELTSLTKAQGGRFVQKLQFGYDANGNRTKQTDQTGVEASYTYDQANRLVDYAGKAQYAYNGVGLRMSKTVGGVAEAFTWDVAAPLPTIIQDGTTRYVTGANGLPLEQIAADGTVRYYHQDAVGSTRALTNASGQVVAVYAYDPYGNVTSFSSGNLTNPFQFAGQYTDTESGLQYLRARYYDPSTGNFMSRDPAGALTGETYSYANDSPLNFIDPTGLGGLALIGGAVFAFLFDNADTFSFIFSFLGHAFDIAAPPVGAILGGISFGFGALQAVKDLIEHKAWYETLFDFLAPLAQAFRYGAGIVLGLPRLIQAIKQGKNVLAVGLALLASPVLNGIRTVATKLKHLATLAWNISDNLATFLGDLGDTLTFITSVVDTPPAAAPAVNPPAPVILPGPILC